MRLRDERGFTLIEIIAVLIILGILAAVAIPKYLGMAEDAELAAAKGVVAELNGRASLAFAKNMINGGTPGQYNSFNSTLEGWTVTISNDVPASFSDLKREGSTTTYSATWRAGDANSPGFWNNIVGSRGT